MSPAKFIDDPNWYKFLPESREPSKKRHLPSHSDCQSLDAESAAMHLRAGGTLGSMPGYEERPGQLDMLRSIVRAFNDRENLMVEAGTGVGKSLAYLIPSILWAWTNDTPVIVSTATRNLQSQLINSDIPKALAILGDKAKDFKVALLKGRSNYLCLRALGEFFSSGFWSMSEEDKREMPHLIEWLRTTPDGDLDQYDGLPRGLLTCPGEECSGRKCPFYSRCFVYQARKNAADAHLVVANHALVLVEAANNGSLLPAYGRLVLDEAHNLEDIATEQLSYEFSSVEFARILNRLSRKRRGQLGGASGILPSIDRQLRKGALATSHAQGQLNELLMSAPGLISQMRRSVDATLAIAERMFALAGRGRDIVRYRFYDGRRQLSENKLFKDCDEGWDEDELISAQTRMESDIATAVNMLNQLKDTLDNSANEGEFNFCSDLATQTAGAADSLVEFMNAANFVLSGDKDTHTYWIEKVRDDNRRRTHTRLVAAPLSVAEALGKLLWDVKDSAILSSATLRVGRDFKYMAKRLGCTEQLRFKTFLADSPFDYFRQSLALAADWLPDPATAGPQYNMEIADVIRGVFAASAGRGLVLFTSYEMMNAVASAVREPLAAEGMRLIVQGEGMSREAMTTELKQADSDVVLFGSQSFWEGVDVAGGALSCVVIARLPFAQVGDPIVEARSEKIDREGGSSFREYALPEAVIKFRQGFGRLIRSKRDRGVVVIVDPRIVTKTYGGHFRNSIPATVHTITNADDLFTRICDFFE